jgi:hypothetical protein
MNVGYSSEEIERSYRGVTVTIMRITPSMASDMMRMNTKNRPLVKRHAERFRDAMASGDWWMNGETIIFASTGVLLNGQHRLWGIIQSGVAVDVMVVTGIDEEAFKTMDGVRTRRAGEVLGMAGEANASAVAACVQALLAFCDSGGTFMGSGSTSAARKATPSTCEKVLDAHPGIRDSVVSMKRNTIFNTQHATTLHYLFSLVSQPVADDFARVLADGDSDIGRPFVVFRESLLRVPHRTDLRKSYCAKAIKAFNAELTGDRPKMFRFSVEEDFPTIARLDYEELIASIEFRSFAAG